MSLIGELKVGDRIEGLTLVEGDIVQIDARPNGFMMFLVQVGKDRQWIVGEDVRKRIVRAQERHVEV